MYNNANILYRLGYQSQAGPAPAARTLAIPPPATQSKIPVAADTKALVQTPSSSQIASAASAADVRYLAVQWVTYVGQIRARFIQNNDGLKDLTTKSYGISRGNIGTLQNDGITPAVNTTGQIYVKPDPESLKVLTPHERPSLATVMSSWTDERGVGIRECPRSNLQKYVDEIEHQYGIKLLVGFEIEVTFLQRSVKDTEDFEPQDFDERFQPMTKNHSWGSFSSDDWLAFPTLATVADGLRQAGIPIQQFHSESGPGQYEFVLLPDTAVLAVDTLYQARQIISNVADNLGYRATFHASPISGVGNAAHAHISLNPSGSRLEDVEPHFWAGVLDHLEAICAFGMPEQESYKRVVADHWTGGVWVAWGTQNRETPVRKVVDGRWEVRCLDAFANMYLALGAIVAAGLLGLRERAELMPGIAGKIVDAERLVNQIRLTPIQQILRDCPTPSAQNTASLGDYPQISTRRLKPSRRTRRSEKHLLRVSSTCTSPSRERSRKCSKTH
jgi:glutamine synthetase